MSSSVTTTVVPPAARTLWRPTAINARAATARAQTISLVDFILVLSPLGQVATHARMRRGVDVGLGNAKHTTPHCFGASEKIAPVRKHEALPGAHDSVSRARPGQDYN